MKKFTLKLDAICAKLKEGLTDGAPINGISLQHQGGPVTGHHPSSAARREILNGSESGVSPCHSANELDSESTNSQDEGNEENGFLEADPLLGKGLLNGHAETTKILSGASKRKARLKLAPRRVVDSVDTHPPHENGYSDSLAVDMRYPGGEGMSKTINRGCSNKSQGSNTSDSTSMQISLSRQDLDSADNQGNNYVYKTQIEGALSNRSSPTSDDTPLWYADDLPSENGDYREMYEEGDGDDEDSLDELDDTPNPANLSNLKAIQEYAERSLTDDQSGQPIEEGLATNDVICEVSEEGMEEADSSSTMQNETGKPSPDTLNRNTDDDDDDNNQDEEYTIPADFRRIPLKIPLPVFGKKDKHGNPYDPSVVQEYASDTMNELIGMYGFEERSNPDIAKDVPLDSFSFKNIQKMEEKNSSKRKKDAIKKYIHRRASLHVPDLARLQAAHSSTSPDDTGSHLPQGTDESDDLPNQGNLLGGDVTSQLASQAGVGGRVASLPQATEPQSKMRLPPPPFGKTSKTVKDLINEQKGREEGAELEEGEDEFRPKRFSKYDFFIQSLEAGQAIDYSAHRISKYDSYIRKLKAGEAIHKVIGRRQSASQKIRDIISTQIHRKHEHSGDAAQTSEEQHGEATDEMPSEAFNPVVNNHIKTSKYASKYDYYLNKLRNGEDVNPYEIILPDPVASTSGSETTSNGIPSQSTNGHAALLDYTSQAGDLGNLVIAEEPEQQQDFGEGTSKRNISNGLAKMVKDEITPGEMNVFSKYITRYSGSAHCGHLHCVYQFKEHYHCIDEGCNFARFTRKEDVVRHYNWHKRRDNSLQHGFMRFSPSDNCGPYYPECTINLKHTHYHCLQTGCNKVYTSTSDVLTHENFHKKNMSLINEGFQRFRATEDCGVPNCTFYGHKTTHFHCRRPGCDFVFKNKCDIEKHKTYHIKDDIYRKDGFKKFSKHEKCKYNWCKYSNNTNHFHCIRKNCGFVFTAANQMQSHKRKHDRRQRILEYEAARHQRGFSLRLIRPKPTPGLSTMRRLRDTPETVLIQADGSVLPQRVKPLDYLSSPTLVPSTSQLALTPITHADDEATTTTAETDMLPSAFTSITSGGVSSEEGLSDSLNLPVASHISPPQLGPGVSTETTASSSAAPPPAAAAAACIALATAASQSGVAPSRSAGSTFSSPGVKEGKPEEPWQKYLKRYHMLSDEANDLGFQYFQQGESCEELFPGCSFSPLAHYHCMWSLKPGIYCGEVVHTGSSLMRPHYEKHKMNPELESIHISAVSFAEVQARSIPKTSNNPASATISTPTHTQSSDPSEVPGSTPATDLLPSTSSPGVASSEGFITCEPDVCTVEDCPHRAKQHYHCTRGDCQFATESQDMLRDHKVNESVIFQSFRQMSRKMDCRRPGCKYNLLNKHYHCLHQGCNFSFLQIQQMESHGRKHMRRIYGKHFNKPGGSLIGPQQLVIPMVSASSVPFSSAVSNQIMFTSAAPILTMPSLTPSVVPGMSSANTGIMNAGSLGLMSVGGMGVVNQVGVPIQMITPSGPTSSSKPLPPFMIPLPPLDEEDVNGNQQQPSTSQNYNGIAQLKYQPLALNSHEDVYPAMVPMPRKRSLNLIEEDPGAPSGYKRYKRGPLDSMMMDRFRRFDRSETCGEDGCQFNMTTTHYHCLHEDCTYRFAGKTMMYKHAQHHDRVNSIIQHDFRRFKANNECEQDSCPYQGNSTHFHCLRCTFVCTDSGKVAVHRKQHVKTDTISAAGFRQYSSAEPCGFVGCKYTLRYSHFHCTRDGCVQGVIGMTQMETHRRRHMLNVRV